MPDEALTPMSVAETEEATNLIRLAMNDHKAIWARETIATHFRLSDTGFSDLDQ